MTTTALREETVNVAGKPIFVAEAGAGWLIRLSRTTNRRRPCYASTPTTT